MFAKVFVILTFISLSKSVLLYSNATYDPKCVKAQCARNMDIMWAMKLFGGQEFNIPMASTQSFLDLAEMFLGKPVSSTDELSKMCPEARISGITLTLRGFNTHFMIHSCYIIKRGIQDCKAAVETENRPLHTKADAIQTLSWTDNETGMVMVRCVPGGKNDWAYYSTEKIVPEKTKQEIRDHVTKLGLDGKDIYMTPYENC